jgi:hypothetical protein
LILKQCALRLPVRTVGKYLQRWGYTAKRPRRQAKDQDTDEVHQWLAETYPRIQAHAAQEQADIFWADETGVAANEHPHVGYARQGKLATLSVPDSHIRINLISAINNAGALRFMTYKGTMDAALFLVFLGRLLRTTTRKVFLIVDRLTAHEAAKVENWVAARRERLELFSLPRRAPERNPDEYRNNDLLGNVQAASLPNSKDALRSQMQQWMRTLFY